MTKTMSEPAARNDGCVAMADPFARPRRVRAVRRRSIVVRLPDATLGALCDRAETLGLRAPAELAAAMLQQACATPQAAPEGDPAEMPRLCGAAPVLLATARPQLMAHLIDSLRGPAGTCHVADDLDHVQRDVDAGRWVCLVVDADSLGDLRAVVDRLVILRARRPDLPVILITRRVLRDDFDLERLPLCDVTLRGPADPRNMAFALQEAAVNNRVWVTRRRMLHLARADMAPFSPGLAG